MGFRDRCAVSVAPIFLRLALGVTFIWAGSAKVFDEKPVTGADAAILANLGVLSAPPKAAPPAATEPAPTPGPTESAPPATPTPTPTPKQPAGGPPALLQLATPAAPAPGYTAEDFPTEVQVRAVHLLTLHLVHSANPPDGKMALWPDRLAQGRWPVYAAWAVALTELIGGCWLILGLFTRFAALGIACVMLGAMWLTQFGPAIQTGQTYLGFIPRHPIFGLNAGGMPLYGTLMWQMVLLAGALALLFAGSGALAIDRALFGRAPAHPGE